MTDMDDFYLFCDALIGEPLSNSDDLASYCMVLNRQYVFSIMAILVFYRCLAAGGKTF